MFTLKVENSSGQVITLTQNETNYQIVDIEGLNPPKAIINSSVVAGMDGSKFNSSRLEERNIVITLRLNGDVEKNRLLLYKYFRTKQKCKIYYSNSSRDVFIEGYVESVECGLFSVSEIMQISIICHNPYFKEAQEIVDDISKVTSLFEFPFAFGARTDDSPDEQTDEAIEFSMIENEKITNVINNSELETGLIIELTFDGDVVYPEINDVVNGYTFKINGKYGVGDKIVINTNRGSKSVVLYKNGVPTNIFNRITKGSTWLQLSSRDNFYAYSASIGSENIHVLFKHYTVYGGV